MSNALDNAQINRLTQTILKNPSASARKEGLLEIRKFDDAQVTKLLEQVARDDKDSEVRDLAFNLLSKRRISSMLEDGTFEDKTTASAAEEAAKDEDFPPLTPGSYAFDDVGDSEFKPVKELEYHTVADESRWTCRFCDSENVGGHFCDHCGAHRGDQEVTAPPAHRQMASQPDDDVFLLHPTNRGVLSGQPQRAAFVGTGTGLGCILLFMIPFILAGVMVGAFMVKEWRDYQLLSSEGIVADGTYVSRRYDDDDDGTSYYATYRFQAGAATFETEHSVDWEVYNRVEPGAPVQVVYAPSNPDISRIAGTNGMESALFLTVFTVCWNLITWGIFLAVLVGFRSDRRLARDGQIVNGELISATGRRANDGDFHVKVEYSFLPPDTDQVIVKTESAERNDLKNDDLPGEGTPVAVLYLNPTHFKML